MKKMYKQPETEFFRCKRQEYFAQAETAALA